MTFSGPGQSRSIARIPTAIAVVVIGLVGLAIYARSFSAPFVFDDVGSIVENTSIRHLTTAWSPPADTTVAGRPLLNVSLAVNYAYSKLNVRSYHITNAAIHVLGGIILFGIVRRTLRHMAELGPASYHPDSVSLLVAVAWIAHPLQTEAVTYTVQRGESLAGLFGLLTLYGFIRSSVSDRHRLAWQSISWTACAAGVLTKETAVILPILVLLYDRVFVSGSFVETWRRRRWYYVALAALWIPLGYLIAANGGRSGTAGLSAPISMASYAATQCYAIAHYLRLVVWPSGQVFDYGTPTITSLLRLSLPLILLMILIGSILVTWRQTPRFAFLGVAFLLLLSPTSTVVPISTQTMAEHRMYLAVAPVLLAMIFVFRRALGRQATIPLIAMGLLFAISANARNGIYTDTVGLWSDTVSKAPTNARALNNLGLALSNHGQLPAALNVYERATHLAPRYASAHNNLGVALRELGRTDDAIIEYRKAIEVRPDYPEAHANLGRALLLVHRRADAINQLETALRLSPDYAEAHENLGLALQLEGQAGEALPHLARAAELRPENANTHESLAFVLAASGRHDAALAEFRRAAELAPKDPEIRNNFGVALLGANQGAEAAREFDAALQLRPDFEAAKRNRELVSKKR